MAYSRISECLMRQQQVTISHLHVFYVLCVVFGAAALSWKRYICSTVKWKCGTILGETNLARTSRPSLPKWLQHGHNYWVIFSVNLISILMQYHVYKHTG